MQLNNSVDKKRVFILGAGASISHSKGIFPSIDGFFPKALECKIIRKSRDFDDLVEYIKNSFNVDILKKKPFPKLNIEKIYTQLEIEIESSRSTKYAAIREKLLELIKKTLLYLEVKINTGQDSDYHKLQKELKPSDTVINFNWDILLDDILGRKERLNGNNEEIKCKQYSNFLNYFTAYGEMTDTRIAVNLPIKEKEWQKEIGFYLKMHGSIDWRYCNNDLCRGEGKGFPVPDLNEPYMCSECYEPMDTLLIPPVLNKQYRKYSLIRKIWNVAVKEIELANEIIILGYSLPPTDFYSEWLLRKAGKSLEKLILIDPKILKKPSEEQKRSGERRLNYSFVNKFLEVFSTYMTEKVTLYEYFEDYLNRNDIVDKKYKVRRHGRYVSG